MNGLKKKSGTNITGLFLISNKHVFAKSKSGKIRLTRGSESGPILGKFTELKINSIDWNRWTGHPIEDIDIAALPLNPIFNNLHQLDQSIYFKHISTKDIKTNILEHNLRAIEDILFIGYPNGIFDEKNNLPIARKGITATPPTVDYDGKPIFLIDASVFPGSSGSPVFIYNTGSWLGKDGPVLGHMRIKLIGVLSAVLYRVENGRLEFREVPANVEPVVRTKEMLDIGVVYKANTIIETIEHILKLYDQ